MATLTILGGRRNPPEIRYDLDGVVGSIGWGSLADMVADLTSGRELNEIERAVATWLRHARQADPNLNNLGGLVGRRWRFDPASVTEI